MTAREKDRLREIKYCLEAYLANPSRRSAWFFRFDFRAILAAIRELEKAGKL